MLKNEQFQNSRTFQGNYCCERDYKFIHMMDEVIETIDDNCLQNSEKQSNFSLLEYLDPEYLKEHVDIDFLQCQHTNVGHTNYQRYTYSK